MKNIFLIFFIFFAVYFAFPSALHAQSGGLWPFGGMILATIPCTTPPGATWMSIGLPVPALVLYQPPLSILYKNFRPFFGSWTVGQYRTGGATCTVGACPFCVIFGAFGIIHHFGTS